MVYGMELYKFLWFRYFTELLTDTHTELRSEQLQL